LKTEGTLAELERELLRFSYLIKPHRSYVVNLGVKEVTKKEVITVLGTQLPLARGRHDEIAHAFLSQIFREVDA
jgi:DNA-binding LytR/AlgR family response regulator